MPENDSPSAPTSATQDGTGARLKRGAIQLTYIDGHTSALLTVRGEDHDLSPAEMRVLAQALTEAASAATTAYLLAEGSP